MSENIKAVGGGGITVGTKYKICFYFNIIKKMRKHKVVELPIGVFCIIYIFLDMIWCW